MGRPSSHPGVSLKALRGLERKAYFLYYGQKKRSGVAYNSMAEFIAWYVREMKLRRHLKRPEVGRRDHSKPYSIDNIDLIERTDNIKERNARCGNPCRKHRAVWSCALNGKRIKKFKSKVEAAAFYKISEKTVYNHCMGRTKQFFKFGKWVKDKRPVRFEWSE